jgi:ribose transport system permease protein
MSTASSNTQASATAAGRRFDLNALKDLRSIGPLVILPLLVIVFTSLNSRFFTSENLLNIVRQSSVLMVLAMAATFVIIMGSIDLSVGSIVTLAGLTGAVLIRDLGEIAVLLIPLIGLAGGAINGALFAFGKLPSFLVTLGTLYAFQGLALYIGEGTSVPLALGLSLDPIINGEVLGIPTIALWALLLLVIGILVLRYTRFGRYTYVLGGGESVARLSGVPVARYKFYFFLISGLLASLAGMLLMFRNGGGDPNMGTSLLLPTIAAVVMGGTPLTGGVGGVHRTVLGVLIITVLSNGMTLANVHPYLQVVIQGCVVIGAVALAMDRSRLTLVK